MCKHMCMYVCVCVCVCVHLLHVVGAPSIGIQLVLLLLVLCQEHPLLEAVRTIHTVPLVARQNVEAIGPRLTTIHLDLFVRALLLLVLLLLLLLGMLLGCVLALTLVDESRQRVSPKQTNQHNTQEKWTRYSA
jgi:hypothetical protein